MAKVGYARVSTRGQDPGPQVKALEAAGCTKVFVEKVSGYKSDRPELAACLAYLRDGEDVLTVAGLDRLGRSVQHLLGLAAELEGRHMCGSCYWPVMQVRCAWEVKPEDVGLYDKFYQRCPKTGRFYTDVHTLIMHVSDEAPVHINDETGDISYPMFLAQEHDCGARKLSDADVLFEVTQYPYGDDITCKSCGASRYYSIGD